MSKLPQKNGLGSGRKGGGSRMGIRQRIAIVVMLFGIAWGMAFIFVPEVRWEFMTIKVRVWIYAAIVWLGLILWLFSER